MKTNNKLTVGEVIRYARKIVCKKNTMPEVIIFFVTTKCNARCSHCFFWRELNSKKKEMSLDEIRKFSKNLPNFSHLFISGGEPFIRNDFSEIIEMFYRNNNTKSISIPTNGILTNKIRDDVDKICTRNPELRLIIDFSLDDLGEKHNIIRGVPGIFDKVLLSIKEIKKLQQKHNNLNMGIICVFNAKNQDNIYNIYNYIKENIKPDSVSFPLIRDEPKDKDYKKVDVEKYGKFINFLEKEYKNKVFEGYNNQPLQGLSKILSNEVRKNVYNIAKNKKYLMPCYASQLMATVYSNGEVCCCESINSKLGNLYDVDFDLKKIWFSKIADEIRATIKNTKCFCTHECFMHTNLIFNPKHLIKLLIKTIGGKNE